MSEQTTRTDGILLGRYREYRTQRSLKTERAYAHGLPGWRNQHRRRLLVKLLVATFAFMALVCVLCAIGIEWAPLLWLPACAVFFPLLRVMRMVSGRRGEVPEAELDEIEVAQRNSARSVGLSVTQVLMMVPAFYLIFGAVITNGMDTAMAYAGGLMVLTVSLIGGTTPAMILGWTRTDPDVEIA